MQKKFLFRWFFVFFVVGVCVFYVVQFKQYLRSTSDPLAYLTADTDRVIKVNDGLNWLEYLQKDSIGLQDALLGDWKLWMNWKKDNPIIHELMEGQSAYWIHRGNHGWFLFLPIPDRWNEDKLELLLTGVPHLMQWEGCLVWSGSLNGIDDWSMLDESGLGVWKGLLEKCDAQSALNYLEVKGNTKVALDYNRGEWVGFVNDNQWLSQNQPLQPLDSLCGNAVSTLWLSVDPYSLTKSEKMKKRVFSLDTLCQCNVLESWVSWQANSWKYQSYDGSHWVASQKYLKNPWKEMSAFIKDTSSRVVKVKHPEWMPFLAESAMPLLPRFIAKKQGRVMISDDSLSIYRAINDTSKVICQPDFSGFSEERWAFFRGRFNQFPGLNALGWADLISSKPIQLVVIKNNNDWLLRLSSIKE
jgi:hypothetical protein